MHDRVAVGITAVVVVGMVGGWWLLRGESEPDEVGTATGPPAPFTTLNWPARPSHQRSVAAPPEPYPEVPAERVEGVGSSQFEKVRTANDGRQLLIPASDGRCSREEVRVLSEQANLVTVEIRRVGKPPSGVTLPPGTSTFSCISIRVGNEYAVVPLLAPLGERRVRVRQ